MGPSKRTSCLTSSAPWLGATPFLPSSTLLFRKVEVHMGRIPAPCRKNMSTPQQTKKPHWLHWVCIEIMRNQLGPGPSDFGPLVLRLNSRQYVIV